MAKIRNTKETNRQGVYFAFNMQNDMDRQVFKFLKDQKNMTRTFKYLVLQQIHVSGMADYIEWLVDQGIQKVSNQRKQSPTVNRDGREIIKKQSREKHRAPVKGRAISGNKKLMDDPTNKKDSGKKPESFNTDFEFFNDSANNL